MKKLLLIVMFIFSASFIRAEDIASTRSVKQFFKNKSDLRVAVDSIDLYKSLLNELSQKVIERATELAKGDDRTTVLKRDIDQASDEVFRKSPMTIAELMEKIEQLPIVDLTELSNQVKAYSDELLKKKKKK